MRGPFSPKILLAIALSGQGCAIVQPLQEPAWSIHTAGSVGLIGHVGVLDDFDATGGMEAATNFGKVEFDVATDLESTLGLVTGAEVFFADDVSLRLGADYRRFRPSRSDPFVFEELDTLEYFVATRWTLPHSVFGQERLRPFIEAKLGLRPETSLGSKVDLIPGAEPADFRFEGSPSWNVGLAGGVSYQLQDRLVCHLYVLHEWPLTESDDLVALDVLPGFDPLLLDSELDAGGMLALFGVTYFF